MALPSQTERTSEMSRPVMVRPSSKAGGIPRPALIGGGVVVLVAVTIVAVSFLTPAKPKTQDVPGKTDPKLTDAGKTPAKDSHSLATPTPGTLSPGGGQGGTTAPAAKPILDLTQGAANSTDATKPAPVDLTSHDLKPTAPVTPGLTPGGSAPASPLAGTGSTSQVRGEIEAGDRAMSSGKPVEARVDYSRALMNTDISRADADLLRDKLTRINDDLVFSKTITPGDPLVESYTVQGGDSLGKIARKRQLATEWQLIERINKVDSRHLRVGAKLKLVRGPFHVVVHKSDFRLDLFAGSPDEPSDWVYIRSFKVGLGSEGGTPVGNFRIKKDSKLINPTWVNPRTGEKFAANDPKNPIGEYWLGWEGQGDSAAYKGFGLHGTIDPASIGQEKSMGCVRMLNDDVAMVYELLVPEVSQVKVVP